jgi:hypothetical protein
VDGRIFLTTSSEGYGLVDTGNACIPTESEVDLDGNNTNPYDYYYGEGPFVVDAFPPAAHPGGAVTLAPGDYAHIWLQFDTSVPKGRKINGMVIEITDMGGDPVLGATPVYFLQNDIGASGTKRWDGPATAPDYPEYIGNNPQVLVAVTAFGLQKSNQEIPHQMYTGSAGGFITLLGTLCVDATDYMPGEYNIDIIDINYSEGTADPDNWGGASFTVTPEPASLLLLGLAGLVLRRR